MRKVGGWICWTCFGGWDSRNAPFFEDPFPVEGMMMNMRFTEKILAAFADRQLSKLNNFQGSRGICFGGG